MTICIVWAPGKFLYVPFLYFLIPLASIIIIYRFYLTTTGAMQRQGIDGPHNHNHDHCTPNHHCEQLLAGGNREQWGWRMVRGNEPGQTTRGQAGTRDRAPNCCCKQWLMGQAPLLRFSGVFFCVYDYFRNPSFALCVVSYLNENSQHYALC